MGLIFQHALEDDLAILEEIEGVPMLKTQAGYGLDLTLGRIQRTLVSWARVAKHWKKSLPYCGSMVVWRLNVIFTRLGPVIFLSRVISLTRTLQLLCQMEVLRCAAPLSAAPLSAAPLSAAPLSPMLYDGYIHANLGLPCDLVSIYTLVNEWWTFRNPADEHAPKFVLDLGLRSEPPQTWGNVSKGLAPDNIYTMRALEPEWDKVEDDTSLPGFFVRAIVFTGNEFVPIPSFAKKYMLGDECPLMPKPGTSIRTGKRRNLFLLVRLYSRLSHRAYVFLHCASRTLEELEKGEWKNWVEE